MRSTLAEARRASSKTRAVSARICASAARAGASLGRAFWPVTAAGAWASPAASSSTVQWKLPGSERSGSVARHALLVCGNSSAPAESATSTNAKARQNAFNLTPLYFQAATAFLLTRPSGLTNALRGVLHAMHMGPVNFAPLRKNPLHRYFLPRGACASQKAGFLRQTNHVFARC